MGRSTDITVIFARQQDCMYVMAVQHDKEVDVIEAVKKAFVEWVARPGGRAAYLQNGATWSAALGIPDEILETVGIWSFSNLIQQLSEHRLLGLCGFEHMLVVEHDEALVSEDEIRCAAAINVNPKAAIWD